LSPKRRKDRKNGPGNGTVSSFFRNRFAGFQRLYYRQSARRGVEEGDAMDFIEGVIRAGLMVVFLLIVIGALAALFMIVFGIATGIDDKIQG
jgi:hypothetical protein